MKKKLTAILLSLTMITGMASSAMAGTLKEDLLAIMNLSGIFSTGLYEKTAENAIKPKTVDVDTDVEVKANNAGEDAYAQSVEIEGSGKVDFRATMDMAAVQTAYNQYLADVRRVLSGRASLETEINNLVVDGEFVITVKFPEGLKFDEGNAKRDVIKLETAMAGFENNEAGVVNGVFVEESRVLSADNKTLTITVGIKGGTKASALATDVKPEAGRNDAFEDLVLKYDGFSVSEVGTDKIVGTVTGYIDIKDVADPIAHIDFVAKDFADSKKSDIEAVVKVKEEGPSGTGGGIVVNKNATVTLNDGEKDYEKKEVKLTNGKYIWDFATVDAPVSDGNKVFIGWFKDADCKKPASAKETITKNTTFYAGWLDTKFDIDYKLNGKDASVNTGKTGSVVITADDIVVREDGVEVRLSDITIKGAKILGWYLDPEHTIPADDSVIVTEDTTFYAVTEEIDVPPALDTNGDHYAYIIGYPEGDVRPENSITREEVATIFFRLLTEETRNANFKSANNFKDVNADRWSNNAISTMAEMGIVTGYVDGTFRPSNNITRAEFATIAARFDDDDAGKTVFKDMAGHWAEDYVAEAASLQWINGYSDGTFKPDNFITRAEVMAIVNRMLKRSVSSENIHADAIRWIDNPETAWYYEDVIEATNSHKFDRLAEGLVEEKWTELLENRDWSELEK